MLITIPHEENFPELNRPIYINTKNICSFREYFDDTECGFIINGEKIPIFKYNLCKFPYTEYEPVDFDSIEEEVNSSLAFLSAQIISALKKD